MTTSSAALPLFYSRPVPMNPQRHGAYSLDAKPHYSFAQASNALPLNVAEFAPACHDYPIVFASNPGQAEPMPVAVVGLRDKSNLFVDAKGQWTAGVYVPAYVRRFPFIFLEQPESDTLTLMVDEAAAVVTESAANPFFRGDETTDLTRNALEFCKEYHLHAQLTQRYVQALVKADVLVENRADVTIATGEKLSLTGFLRVDEARLQALPAATIAEWHREGWLAPVYAHLLSISRLGKLVDAEAFTHTQGNA